MDEITRRSVFGALAATAAGIAGPFASAEEAEEIAPAEDLMREHGVLKRVLFVYDEVGRRIAAGQYFPPAAVKNAAWVIRKFIEEYHEKLEEEHLFPRFRKKRELVGLVDVLEAQHQAGRRLTDRIVSLTSGGLTTDEAKRSLAAALHDFVRMYGPHEAREDTVLFPALHEIVTRQEYDALGEQFERKEHELFGRGGFEGMVDRVATIEKSLGIFDLAQFTPR